MFDNRLTMVGAQSEAFFFDFLPRTRRPTQRFASRPFPLALTLLDIAIALLALIALRALLAFLDVLDLSRLACLVVVALLGLIDLIDIMGQLDAIALVVIISGICCW